MADDLVVDAALVRLPRGALDDWGVEALVLHVAADALSVEAADVLRARVEAVRANRRALQGLLRIPKIEQRSPAWYAARENLLTASDLAQALGKGAYGSRLDLLLDKTKVKPRVFSAYVQTVILQHGVMFEEMALRAYTQARGGVAVHEFGLLQHPTLGCFGASPDGITELGTMIEIKCPFKRKIDGNIPINYYYQMQGQMAVGGIGETDYVEAKFERYGGREAYLAAGADAAEHGHGVTLRFLCNSATEYAHSPPWLTQAEAVAWADAAAGARLQADAGLDLLGMVYWRITQLAIQRVAFDAEAWRSTLAPAIQAFHDDRTAMAARLQRGLPPYEGYAPKEAKEPKKRAVAEPQWIDDDEAAATAATVPDFEEED